MDEPPPHRQVTFSPQAIAELKRKLQAYGKDVYAKKDLAYQHFEVGGQVLIEGEHVERTRLRKGWIEELDLRGKTRSLRTVKPAPNNSKTPMKLTSDESLMRTAVWPSSGGKTLAKACGRTTYRMRCR